MARSYHSIMVVLLIKQRLLLIGMPLYSIKARDAVIVACLALLEIKQSLRLQHRCGRFLRDLRTLVIFFSINL